MKSPVQLGYTLGTSLLLSAAAYFYASNWEALSRWEKLAPLLAAIALMYALSEFFARRPGRAFLSRLALLAGCLFFGVGVALVGQMYNSHADSYSLFAVWLIPALLLAVITRWPPFSVLSFILALLAYLLYFFPGFRSGIITEWRIVSVLLAAAAVNLVILILAERRLFASPAIKALSFTTAFGLMLYASNSLALENLGVWVNLPLFLLLAFAVPYYYRTRQKSFLLLSGLFVSILAIVKYTELLIHFLDESFILWSLIFVVLFIWGNVRFLNLVRSSPSAPAQDSPDNDAVSAHNAFTAWASRILAAVAIAIATVLGTAVIIGFLVLIVEIDHPEYAMCALGAFATVGAIAAEKLNGVVRYTFLTCGMVMGVSSGIILDNLPVLLFFLLTAVGAFVFIPGTVQRIYCLVAGAVMAWVVLDWLLDGDLPVFSALGAVLLILLLAAWLLIKQPGVRNPLLYGGYPSFLLVFFILTFITEGTAYYLMNGLFFLTVTAAVLLSIRRSLTWVYVISLVFWTAFLVYKYYDLAWKLLHKSFSLALAGLILLGLTRLYERRRGDSTELPALRTNQWRTAVWLLAAVTLLQLGVLSAQTARSEWLLAHGQTIKLELAPVDPRSMLQGDYVILSYDISRPEWGDAEWKRLESNPKAALVLAPDAAGVYRLERLYEEGSPLREGEVLIRGKWDGYRGIDFGIEHYFIPEGTGIDLVNQVRYAEVKLSSKGDAILLRLTNG
jgi:uncharacterized membrane-anchored protein